MFTLKPVAYDFACSSGSDSMMSAARRKARTVFHAKYASTPAPRRAMMGTHPWMLVTAECATTDTARKIVSAVVAPTPTRNPARHDRVTVWDAMIAFTGPGGAASERPMPVPARTAQRITRTTSGAITSLRMKAARQVLYRPASSCGRAHRRFDIQPVGLSPTDQGIAGILLPICP